MENPQPWQNVFESFWMILFLTIFKILLDNLREIRKSIQGDFQEKIRILNEVTASMVEKKK